MGQVHPLRVKSLNNAAILAFLALVASGAGEASAQTSVPRVVISQGGPYIVESSGMQRYRDNVAVPQQYQGRPLILVFSNGSTTASGFSWVRVFQQPGGGDNEGGSGEVGRLLVDENSFLSSPQYYLDMTGQMHAGNNPIYIEGAGPQGATFSWELRSVGPPRLAKLNPSLTARGASLTLSGIGFSLRANENTCLVGAFQIPVLSSTARSITVYIPPNFPEGVYPLAISVRGYESNILKLAVLAAPQISSLSMTSAAPGSEIIINGSGFSTNPADIVVYIGSQRAQVIGSREGNIEIEVPRLERADGLPVTVYCRGIKASGNVRLSIDY